MDCVEEFKSSVKQAAEFFRNTPKTAKVKIVSHLDADGIAACSIVANALHREGYNYTTSIVQQLDFGVIEDLKDDSDCYIFSDLGSGQLSMVKKILAGKKVIVLDHHELESAESEINNSIKSAAGSQKLCSDNSNNKCFFFVNPHVFGIDGNREISGAGVSYLFSKYLNPKNASMAHIAVVGAVGDMQDSGGFRQMNQEIVKDAVAQKLMSVEKNLKIFGRSSRPLYKSLQYSSELSVPGVSNNESGAIQFLQQLGINMKDENGWRTFDDLEDDERKKLVAGLILRRAEGKKAKSSHESDSAEDIFCEHYSILNEKVPMLRNAKEFSSFLNACGRLDNAHLGIAICMGDERKKKEAIPMYSNYKREIVSMIRWLESSKGTEKVIEGSNFMIINGKDEIRYSMIGTLLSMTSKGNGSESGKKERFIMGLARMPGGKTKVSIRYSGSDDYACKGDVNLKEIIDRIVSAAGGDAGGHKDAAGAVIKTSNENRFIEAAKEEFEKINN